ncbi:hypothetical protein EDM80_02015 [bacterium]|nr:MAG: hypothetical protein EDM80_02015 [bacterium]RIK62376.1 MAG: hypothetical protein DCC64_10650 [Planctomycetota bacterium]
MPSTGQKALHARTRVLILIASAPASLSATVLAHARDLKLDHERHLALPAGPYRYPYAFALELARLAQGQEGAPVPDERGLRRADLAQALRRLVLSPTLISVPRLDWLDGPSQSMLSNLMELAALVERQGLNAPLRLIAGLPVDAAPPQCEFLVRTARLLHPPAPPALQHLLKAPQRLVLSLLLASPAPLTVALLEAASGLTPRALNSAIAALAAAGLVDEGPRISASTAAALPDADLARAREALLEGGALDRPDARAALFAELGWTAPEQLELGHQALLASEPDVARFYFAPCARAPHALTEHQALLAARAQALAGFAAPPPELLHIRAPALQAERAALVQALFRQGLLDAKEADVLLRAAARLAPPNQPDTLLRIHTWRAELILSRGRAASALKVLRRLNTASLEAAKPQTRAEYLFMAAKVARAQGRLDMARRNLASALGLSAGHPSRLEMALAALRWGLANAARQLIEESLRVLDARAAAMALDADPRSASTLAGLLGAFDSGERRLAATAGTPREAFGLLEGRGATLMAYLEDGRMQVLPEAAALRPSLSVWLEACLLRAARFPGVSLLPLGPPPETRDLGADYALQFSSLAGAGPGLLLFRRCREFDPEEALDFVNRLAAPKDNIAAVSRTPHD